MTSAQGLWLACVAVLDAADRTDLADKLMDHYPEGAPDAVVLADDPK